MYSDRKENNAQRARRDKDYFDSKSKRSKEKGLVNDDVEVTRYSDGSSTYHHGGPAGDMSYDEFGEEC